MACLLVPLPHGVWAAAVVDLAGISRHDIDLGDGDAIGEPAPFNGGFIGPGVACETTVVIQGREIYISAKGPRAPRSVHRSARSWIGEQVLQTRI